ncbi:hypothetical protein VPHF99_0049 [Vibrio phage F99]
MEKKTKKVGQKRHNSGFRFQINRARLSKKSRHIRDSEGSILQTLKNFNLSKNTAQGIPVSIMGWDYLYELYDLFITDLGKDFNSTLWNGYSEVFKFIHDSCSVKASPDYTAKTLNKANTDYVEVLSGMLESYMRGKGTTRISKKKYYGTCKWFVVYLHKMVKCNNLGILYTRSSNFKSEFGVTNKDFSIPICINLITMLEEYGYVLNFNGNTLYGSRHMSMVIPSPDLLDILHIDGKTYEIKLRPECLVTPIKEGNVHVIPSNGDEAYLVEDCVYVLEKFVNLMNSGEITKCGYPISEYWLKRMLRIDVHHNSRFFDNGTIQCASKYIRSTIEIFGEKTVSLDFKSIHPAILLHKEGYNLKDHNPYPTITEIEVDTKLVNRFKKFYSIDKYDPVRNLIKRLFLCMINADSINKAVGSCYDDLAKDRLKKGNINEGTMKYVGLPPVNLHTIAEQLLKHNHMISKYLGTGVGNALQYADSSIMFSCIKILTEKGIPCLPVHDALICRISDREFVESVMTEAFVDVVGVGSRGNCIIEEE